jgi:hypothetical protein
MINCCCNTRNGCCNARRELLVKATRSAFKFLGLLFNELTIGNNYFVEIVLQD